jgi:hypothetical protein
VLALALVCSATSCATAPDQKYFQKGSLSNIRRILVVTSSEDLTVKNAGVPQEPEHSRGQQAKQVAAEGVFEAFQLAGAAGAAANFYGLDIVLGVSLRAYPLVPAAAVIVAAPICWAVLSGKDASQAKILRSARPKAFDSVREMPTEAEDGRVRDQLVKEDGLVKLKVKQVCLRRVSPYGLSLLVGVSAEMLSLKNGKEDALLWSRQENLDSEEAHPLEFYRTNGIPMLDVSLAKLAKRLADDIVYSK